MSTRRATTLQPNALAVVDASGNAHLDLTWSLFDARPATADAWVFDDHAPAGTTRAWRREGEYSLVLLNDATPVALRTLLWSRARTSTGTVA